MPFRRRALLLSPSMADDVNDFTDAPAPLPPHERPWRHPSELAAHERLLSRLSARRPSPYLTMAAGAIAVALVVLIGLVIAPRSAPREAIPVVRNAATLAGRPFVSPVAATTQAGAPLVAVRNLKLASAASNTSDIRFIQVTRPGELSPGLTSAEDARSNMVVLRTVRHDNTLGLALLESTSPPPPANAPVVLAAKIPVAGASVFILADSPVPVQVGISITADASLFVPLSEMVTALDGIDVRSLPDGLPVVNVRSELVGLLVHRSNAIGFIPAPRLETFLAGSDR